ncbi:Sugar kinase of the NBD/HSP70 family, may contain an N-terminal HTH domain [Nocardioides terrae]|uniref:Sugar kinase of the NBD/HSP70 family, may contain an N-terminal HTH domain n=1 Tax=Nocardioides terrae TaxID=574651 RepID=A0A1I1EVB0_9ACTN|nr:ROK family protein [Nocardioides terrae]SFB91054.1 Sugar kinase of the NBD/HSP70 family, may contain an N-terminal HTH domain [Nocardioides terrae]
MEPVTVMSVGLDVGGTKTLGVALDETGRVVAQVRRPTDRGPAGVVRTAVEVVDGLRDATGDRLAVPVGVGIPGLVDGGLGIVRHAVNVGITGEPFPLGRLLSERLGVSVTVENDANAATLGAVAQTGHDDLVYLSIGTGLAAGLAFDGRLRRGEHGAAGEVGHIPVDPDGVVCGCGQTGCIETITSGSALAASWPVAQGHPADALFAAAAAGDPKAIAVRDRFAAGAATAIRILCLTVDPGLVVLGGGVAQLGEPLRIAVATALGDQAAEAPFLAALDLPGRLRVLPPDVPVAAVGAALVGTGR